MSKFALTRDVDSIKSPQKKGRYLEIIDAKDEYILLEHIGDHVGELASLSKEDWRTVWQMLTLSE